MAKYLTLYHGSTEIIKHPTLEAGHPRNDYGQGFYCTQNKELACEWACKSKRDGFANRYKLSIVKLRTLDLLDGSYTALHWIALLLAHRDFTLHGEFAQATRELILERYLIDTAPYDVVIGYRADDAYFSFAESFVEGSLSFAGLEQALYLGQLGEQIALVSHAAFNALEFQDASPAPASKYYPRFIDRDSQARRTYRNTIARKANPADALLAIDILRMTKEELDARIRRISR